MYFLIIGCFVTSAVSLDNHDKITEISEVRETAHFYPKAFKTKDACLKMAKKERIRDKNPEDEACKYICIKGYE